MAVAAAAAVLGGGATAALVLRSDRPAALDQLDRAARAGDEAQEATNRLTDNLDRIAANLKAGAGLSSQSDEIEDLTRDQRRSLTKLAALLRSQLASLRQTERSLRGTSKSSAGVAALGERQTRVIARALAALRRVKGYARTAGAASGRIARLAVYGARLAEDSQKAFSGP